MKNLSCFRFKTDRLFLKAFVLTLLVSVGGIGCETEKGSDGLCRVHEDCGEYQACDMDTGACICIDDRGCGDGEFCNTAARCQALSGCRTNADCLVIEDDLCGSSFCDIGTSRCVGYCECDPDEGETCCTQDTHCPFDQICDSFSGKCSDGCRSDGDCKPGSGCTDLTAGGGVGQCTEGICTANNQCDYQELCNLETGECTYDSRGPYCEACTGGVASEDCGDPGNYCLLDTTDPTGNSEFCGVNAPKVRLVPTDIPVRRLSSFPNRRPVAAWKFAWSTKGRPVVTVRRTPICPAPITKIAPWDLRAAIAHDETLATV